MLIFGLLALGLAGTPDTSLALQAAARERIARDSGAVVGVFLRDPVSGLALELNSRLRFHAASTMKLGVLLELGRRIDAKTLAWTDSVPIKNSFASIVDSSRYTLDPTSDSDSTVYAAVGTAWTVRQLATRMIVRSSNLATNLLVERLGAERITATIRSLGADSMVVLRGVEDGKAYAKGLNNTTTARDLGLLLLAIAEGRAVSAPTGRELLAILEAQEFNDGIPAGLPAGRRVAHKTGEISATWHDAALVYPPDGKPYTLVVLTRNVAERARGIRLQADLARIADAAVLAARRQ